jgi:hypothetical protein
MEEIEEKLKLLEDKLKLNRKLVIIWCWVMGAFVVIVGLTWGRLAPLPKGTKLEIGSLGKKSVLSGEGLTFYDNNGEPTASINVAKRYEPYLRLKNHNSDAQIGLHENGGGQLLIRRTGADENREERKVSLTVAPDSNEVSILLSTSHHGQVQLGISANGEPGLSLAGSRGGRIEMKVNTDGEPTLQMENAEGNVVFAVPKLR